MKKTTKPHTTLKRDLSLQLSLLYFVFVSIVLLATYYFLQYAERHLQTDIIASDLALADAIAQETLAVSQSAQQAVQNLSKHPGVIAGDNVVMESLFGDAMRVRNDVNLIYRLDKSGIMRFHYPVGPDSTVNTDFSFRSYFQQALTRTTPLFSSGRISPTTNQPVATAVMPIWSQEGVFQGVVAMNMKLQFLSDTLTNITTSSYSPETMQIAIIDSEGQIIAHSDTQFLLQNAGDLFQEVTESVLSGKTGSHVTGSITAQGHIYSYIPIQETGWGVVVMRPTNSAFSVIRAFRQGMVMVIIIFLGSGLVFWVVLSRRVIHPLERLASLSQDAWNEQTASGNITAAVQRMTRRADPMGVLTRSLQQMHEAITTHFAELNTLLETSAAVVSTLDSPVVLKRILEQVEQLLGVQMSAIFVLDVETNLFRVEASRNLPSWYAEQVMIDPQDPHSVAMRALHADHPIQISDTETDPTYEYKRQRARMAGYRSLLAIRVNVQYSPPAVLLTCRAHPYTYSQREMNLLLSFANHATMAMDNAALYARSDMNLQEQTGRLQALIQSLQDGLVLEDSHGNVLYANQRIQDLVGLAPEALDQKSVHCLIDALAEHSTDPGKTAHDIRRLLGDDRVRRTSIEQVHDAKSRHLQLTLFDVKDAKHKVTGRGWIISDITQQFIVERMRSLLIASVSHELRTPLAGIKGYVSTLLAEDVEWDTESQREFLGIISRETDRLSKLVQDLLDMSRIEAGNLRVTPMKTALDQMMERIIHYMPAEVGRRLEVNIPPNFPSVSIDPQRVETVLRNLIENAAKYSPDDSPIQVGAEINGDELCLKVADKGPGISQDQRERVFEQFYRIENDLAHRAAGTGLGLAIARNFVHAMGGRIWLEPTAEGACIAFTIPLQMEAILGVEPMA